MSGDAVHKVVFVLGPPGSGKGTQCSRIEKGFGLTHLSAGDLLREERAKGDSEIGQLIDGHIRNGTIVPVEITCKLIENAMESSGNHRGFLVDGFPRNENNLEGWTKAMAAKTTTPFVLFIECPVEKCVGRCLSRGLTSGRTDDNEESLKKRVETYNTQTMPIIQLYQAKDLVRSVDGALEPDQVFEKVTAIFKESGFEKLA